jgi:hypothetical protein
VLIGSRIILRDISTKSIVTLLTEDRESRSYQKISKSIPRWHWWRLVLSIPHVDHGLLYGLKHLSLHHQNLLQVWWWVGVVVLTIIDLDIGVMVPCIDHMKNS